MGSGERYDCSVLLGESWQNVSSLAACISKAKNGGGKKTWEIMIWGISNDKPYRGRKLNFTCSRRELSWYQENLNHSLHFSPLSLPGKDLEPSGCALLAPQLHLLLLLTPCYLFYSALAANSSGGWCWELFLVMVRGKVWFLSARNPPVLLERAVCVRSSISKKDVLVVEGNERWGRKRS